MVISTVNQVVYNGDGVTTAFPFTFRIIEATDIKLLLIDADGAETDITADYYVDTVNNTVYYPGYAPGAEPPAEDQPPKVQAGQKLVVYREIPITQEKDLGEKWPFEVIELGLDKLTMILQQIFDWWGRTLKISQGGSVDGFDTNVHPEAGKIISVNEAGDGFTGVTAMLEENNAWEGKGLQIHNIAGPTSVTDAVTKDYVDQILNGFVLAGDSRTVPVDTLIQLRALDIDAGRIAFTLGYHDVNDGGAGVYNIRTATLSDVDDGGSIIILDNGNVAELITDGTVNVKQFGAVGDGVTEDTTAIQNAVDFGDKVYFPTGNYYTDEITVTRNIEIDCCDSEFTVKATKLFTLTGTEGETTSEADYTAKQVDYTLSDTTYNGFGYITCDTILSRYKTYAFCCFRDGVLCDFIPYDCTNVSVKKIVPITCSIRNISNVLFPNTHDGYVIRIEYGLDCVFDNIRMTNECYSVIYMLSGYRCVFSNLYINLPLYTGTALNTYTLLCGATVDCVFRDSFVHNPYWHCWTSASRGLAIHTTIDNCTMRTDAIYAILDHAGGFATTVVNTTTDGIALAEAFVIRGCNIVSRNGVSKQSIIGVGAFNRQSPYDCIVEDVTFSPASDTSTTMGILFRCSGIDNEAIQELTDKYFPNIVVRNITATTKVNVGTVGFYSTIPDAVTSAHVGNITIDNVNMSIISTLALSGKYDFSNAKIIVKNITRKRNNETNYVAVDALQGATMYIIDSEIGTCTKTGISYSDLYLYNVTLNGACDFEVTGKLMGNGVVFNSTFDLTDTNNVLLNNVIRGSNYYSEIWRLGSANDCYAKKMDNSFTPIDVTLVDVTP